MLAFPLPGEMMMSYIGLLFFEVKLNWLLSIVAAGLGVSAGIIGSATVSATRSSPNTANASIWEKSVLPK